MEKERENLRMVQWNMRLLELEKYIVENARNNEKLSLSRMVRSNDQKISKLGIWARNQKQLYIYRESIMKNPEIRAIWEKFIEKYYIVYFKYTTNSWEINLQKTKDYIDKYQTLPSRQSKYTKIRSLAVWLSNQPRRFKEPIQKENCMRTKHMKQLWDDFIITYKRFLKKENCVKSFYAQLENNANHENKMQISFILN